MSKVNNEELTATSSGNWLNSLNGKVAGLQMPSAGTGPISSACVVLRGEQSLSYGSNDVSLMFKGGEVTITSAETIDTINVYGVNGGLVATYTPASAHFSFAVVHGGLYIVKVVAGGNTKVFKVVK